MATVQKRLAALLLAALLLLSATACGGKKEVPDESSSQPDRSQPDVSAMAPLPGPEPEPEPEPEVLPYVNPLTGEGWATDIASSRPVAIMLNNLKKALPQMGVSQADIIYEVPAEGGITRMLAVFQDPSKVGSIGTVRSARDYYVSLAYGHDAIFMHAGGSPQAYTAIRNWGITALDCVNGPYEGTLFWRDADRRKNAGLEHSVVTSGEKIAELFPTYTFLRTQHKDGWTSPMTFSETPSIAGGTQAETITVNFSTYKTGIFRYDGSSGLYYISEYGEPYVDGNTGEQVGVKNVLILFTDVSQISGDEAGRLSVRTTGTGRGLFACDGKVREITWSKSSNDQPMAFTTSDGKAVQFGIGKSYINIIGGSSTYSIE